MFEIMSKNYGGLSIENKNRRSKLETEIGILRLLAYNKPMRVTHITQKANLNSAKTEEFLTLLVTNQLIKKTFLPKSCSRVYSITQDGLTVLKAFEKIAQTLLFVKKENATCSFANQTEMVVIQK